jgi:hypothetical protein
MSTTAASDRSTQAGDAAAAETEDGCDQSISKKGGGHDEGGELSASPATTTTTTTAKKGERSSTTSTATTTKTTSRRRPNTTTGAATTNELSHLIPGYTAPMRLGAPSLRASSVEGLSDLRARASRADAAAFAPRRTASSSARTAPFGGGGGPGGGGGGGRRGAAAADATAGPGWFDMAPTPMTQQLKTDLSIIRNRGYLDPRKFYKSADDFDGKVLQVGTVIEGSAEFYSSRLTNRERRANLTEEVMADAGVAGYAKRKYRDIQAERDRSGRRRSAGGGGNKRGRKGR